MTAIDARNELARLRASSPPRSEAFRVARAARMAELERLAAGADAEERAAADRAVDAATVAAVSKVQGGDRFDRKRR